MMASVSTAHHMAPHYSHGGVARTTFPANERSRAFQSHHQHERLHHRPAQQPYQPQWQPLATGTGSWTHSAAPPIIANAGSKHSSQTQWNNHRKRGRPFMDTAVAHDGIVGDRGASAPRYESMPAGKSRNLGDASQTSRFATTAPYRGASTTMHANISTHHPNTESTVMDRSVAPVVGNIHFRHDRAGIDLSATTANRNTVPSGQHNPHFHASQSQSYKPPHLPAQQSPRNVRQGQQAYSRYHHRRRRHRNPSEPKYLRQQTSAVAKPAVSPYLHGRKLSRVRKQHHGRWGVHKSQQHVPFNDVNARNAPPLAPVHKMSASDVSAVVNGLSHHATVDATQMPRNDDDRSIGHRDDSRTLPGSSVVSTEMKASPKQIASLQQQLRVALLREELNQTMKDSKKAYDIDWPYFDDVGYP